MLQKKLMEELNRLSPEAFQQSVKHPVVLILDNIRSKQNVGAIFRTADAFAVSTIWLCGFTPIPPHRDIHKTALGATETVTWHYAPDMATVLIQLKSQGYQLVAVEQVHGSQNLQQFAFGSPVALILGNEVDGVSEEALALCDGAVEIPQFGSKHSLNVSVAAGVILWELVSKNYMSSTKRG